MWLLEEYLASEIALVTSKNALPAVLEMDFKRRHILPEILPDQIAHDADGIFSVLPSGDNFRVTDSITEKTNIVGRFERVESGLLHRIQILGEGLESLPQSRSAQK